jgi:hypothetical protein
MKGEQLPNFVEHQFQPRLTKRKAKLLEGMPDWKQEEMLTVGTHTCGGCGAVTIHDMMTPCLKCKEFHSGTVTYPSSRPDQATSTSGDPSSNDSPGSLPRRLSPIFVAWLMGWPLTALGISGSKGMESCRCVPPTHLPGCGAVCGDWLARNREALRELLA